jgi:hypothetical protein
LITAKRRCGSSIYLSFSACLCLSVFISLVLSNLFCLRHPPSRFVIEDPKARKEKNNEPKEFVLSLQPLNGSARPRTTSHSCVSTEASDDPQPWQSNFSEWPHAGLCSTRHWLYLSHYWASFLPPTTVRTDDYGISLCRERMNRMHQPGGRPTYTLPTYLVTSWCSCRVVRLLSVGPLGSIESQVHVQVPVQVQVHIPTPYSYPNTDAAVVAQ